MKLLYALLVTLGKCLPRLKRSHSTWSHESMSSDAVRRKVPQGHKGVPSTQCINQVSWQTSRSRFGTQTVTNLDNAESGTVTVEYYQPDAHCYLDIGSKCNSDGVEVEFTYMSVEDSWKYDPNDLFALYGKVDHKLDIHVQSGCYDTVHFAYTSNGSQVETEGQCGCLHRNHPSCDYEAMYDYDLYDLYWTNAETTMPSKQELIGTDIKLILSSDENHSGKFSVDWKCRTGLASSPSNTIEMAEALLTGPFTPLMATDYGCAGRGFFDPFAPTIGSHTDEVDGFFFTWKKCVQCATGNDKTAILPYSYNINDDTCGKFFSSILRLTVKPKY